MKDAFDYKKPTLWITATLAAASVVPAVLMIRNSRRRKSHLFDQELVIDRLLYEAPFYTASFDPAVSPSFLFSNENELQMKGHFHSIENADWKSLGKMDALTLDRPHFDDLFFTGKEHVFWRLRKQNKKAWQMDVKEGELCAFYYLLQQRNGEVYLAYGYRADGLDRPESTASIIRWLFYLTNANE